MTVGSYTYGTVARVQAMIGDLVASRVFATGTVPTLVEVETILDDVASEIHATMSENGYPTPTSTTLTTNAPRIAGYLANLNSLGAAAQILFTIPSMAASPTAEDAPSSRANWFRKRFQEGMESLVGDYLARLGLARSTSAFRVFAGSAEDANGNVKKPLFKRGETDYPTSRQLTEGSSE